MKLYLDLFNECGHCEGSGKNWIRREDCKTCEGTGILELTEAGEEIKRLIKYVNKEN